MYKDEEIYLVDRIIAVASILSGGTLGVLWLIFCAVTKRSMTKFLMFNIYLSVFLSLFLYILGILVEFAYNLAIQIPYIKVLANMLYLGAFQPLYQGFSIVNGVIFIIYFYMVICAISGKYAKLPWVSNLIAGQIDRY